MNTTLNLMNANYSAAYVSVKAAGKAVGPAHVTVVSGDAQTARVECHGASYSDAANMKASVVREANARMFAFWQDMGVAMQGCPGDGYCASQDGDCTDRMHVRDMSKAGSGMYLPMITADEVRQAGAAGRADRGERSHVIASCNRGAYCPCNVIVEPSAINAARGGADMAGTDLSPLARQILASWSAWWLRNSARKASIGRLS